MKIKSIQAPQPPFYSTCFRRRSSLRPGWYVKSTNDKNSEPSEGPNSNSNTTAETTTPSNESIYEGAPWYDLHTALGIRAQRYYNQTETTKIEPKFTLNPSPKNGTEIGLLWKSLSWASRNKYSAHTYRHSARLFSRNWFSKYRSLRQPIPFFLLPMIAGGLGTYFAQDPTARALFSAEMSHKIPLLNCFHARHASFSAHTMAFAKKSETFPWQEAQRLTNRGFRLSKSVDFRPFNGNNGFKKIVVKVTKTNAAIILNVEIESTGIKVRANARSKFGFFDGQTKRINRSIFS
jgi:hypothetical protein